MSADRDPATRLQHAFVWNGRLTSLSSRRPMLLADEGFLQRDHRESCRA